MINGRYFSVIDLTFLLVNFILVTTINWEKMCVIYLLSSLVPLTNGKEIEEDIDI